MADLGVGGQQWTTMDNNGQQWITIDNNGYQWITMDNNGQQSAVLHASLMPFFWYYCHDVQYMGGFHWERLGEILSKSFENFPV